MNRADKAALRLAVGLGLAVLVAYGLALPIPFVVCVMSVLVLSRPGPPLPLIKGLVIALLFAVLVASGILMVPLLEHYAFAAMLMTGRALRVFFMGVASANPLTMVLVIVVHADPGGRCRRSGDRGRAEHDTRRWHCHRGVGQPAFQTPYSPIRQAASQIVRSRVSPVTRSLLDCAAGDGDRHAGLCPGAHQPVVLCCGNNEDSGIESAGRRRRCALGRQRTGRLNADGCRVAAVVWLGLSLWPTLWMLTLWMMGAALWTGSAIFRPRATTLRPSFWSNALITMLILLGPAIEDSASGKSVLEASAVRTALFVAVALYAWGTVWALERWRNSRRPVLRTEHA